MSIEKWDNLAFEGAQGYGAGATGGRGGEIVQVTNLRDSGEGSLRWALETLDGPRIVVFAVGGQIDLKDEIQINGDVTLAGQTAPDGITVTGARLRVVESNVIVRGMNLRPGDSKDGHLPNDRDGISVGKRGVDVEDVIIDSNSISWALDENTSTWSSPSNVTWSNNIIAEALNDSIHPKGEHSMGMLIGDGSERVSIVGNLFASNDQRNALVKDGSEQIEYINNVVYNYARQGLVVNGGSLHAISNVMIAGDDSNGRAAIRINSGEGSQAFFVSDNISGIAGNATSKIKNKFVFDPSDTEVLPSDEVLESVLDNAGVIINGARSDIDQRIIETVLDDDGTLIDSQRQVGGYLDSVTTAALWDGDGDGIPNRYEALIGSNPYRSDAQQDADGNGLANIEDYINGLLDGFGEVPSGVSVDIDIDIDLSGQGGSSDGGGSSNGGGGAAADGPAAEAFTLEAEDFILESGFSKARLMAASNGTVINALRDGRAATSFDGSAGSYDIDVRYFDENDGVSYLEVQLNGEVLDAWHWDAELGSNLANKRTLTSHVIEQVELEAGDEIVLVGSGGRAREPMRIDALEFTPSDAVLA